MSCSEEARKPYFRRPALANRAPQIPFIYFSDSLSRRFGDMVVSATGQIGLSPRLTQLRRQPRLYPSDIAVAQQRPQASPRSLPNDLSCTLLRPPPCGLKLASLGLLVHWLRGGFFIPWSFGPAHATSSGSSPARCTPNLEGIWMDADLLLAAAHTKSQPWPQRLRAVVIPFIPSPG
jgi:hypothetical protein